jgi:hypothetical protein
MNTYDEKLQEHDLYPLNAKEISTVTVIMGHKCNLQCGHFHVTSVALAAGARAGQ